MAVHSHSIHSRKIIIYILISIFKGAAVELFYKDEVIPTIGLLLGLSEPPYALHAYC